VTHLDVLEAEAIHIFREATNDTVATGMIADAR
jgi:hypothetical protein